MAINSPISMCEYIVYRSKMPEANPSTVLVVRHKLLKPAVIVRCLLVCQGSFQMASWGCGTFGQVGVFSLNKAD